MTPGGGRLAWGRGLAYPPAIAASGDGRFRAYFGNLQLHSNLSHDRMAYDASPEQAFRIVYDVAGLDFADLSDRAEHFRESDWWTVTKYTEPGNQPGRVARFAWTDRDPPVGTRDSQLRASQADGQLGGSSPVWVSAE